ncbi:MAG: FtsW/RodA/SpoVE family cell cycle protein [Erysipelothrix sp.]|nr:FtsW/RodA/SpoVE family cell cycle protein [Erysipelothrix sp.]
MKLSPKFEKNKFNIDWFLVGIFALFLIISITSIHLATPIVSRVTGLVVKQIIWYVTGFSLMALLIYFGIENLYDILIYVYAGLMIALGLLYLDSFSFISVPFVEITNNTRAWFVFPGIGNFQPSEFMKVVLLLMTANIISKHNSQKTEVSFKSDITLFINILKIALPPLILIVLQPDTGIPLVIIISIMIMVAVSGIKRIWIYVGATLGIGLFGGFIILFYTNQQFLIELFGSSLRLSRFYGWLETEKYIRSYGNQLYEGLLAIGSAGWFGHPLGQGIVWFAEPQNDFIFAVIGQNFGFIGTSLVIVLFFIFDIKLLIIALNNDSMRDKMMVIGLLGMILFQQVENMGMISGLLPITGITLPFISYGGSSLWSYMIPLSVIFRMSSDNINKKGSLV